MLGAHPGPGPGAPALDPGPAPHCGGTEGRREGRTGGGGCLAERCGERPRVTLTWRQLRECSRPGPGPGAHRTPHARTSADPGLLLGPVPATLFRSPGRSPASRPPPPAGPPGFRRSAAPRPRRRPNSLFPECSRPPSPPPQPDPRALPRILGPSRPLPGPHPTGARGGEGAQARAPPPPAPHCSRWPSRALRATPQEPRRPQLTALGSGEGRKAESSPRGLNPLNALPQGGGLDVEDSGVLLKG